MTDSRFVVTEELSRSEESKTESESAAAFDESD